MDEKEPREDTLGSMVGLERDGRRVGWELVLSVW